MDKDFGKRITYSFGAAALMVSLALGSAFSEGRALLYDPLIYLVYTPLCTVIYLRFLKKSRTYLSVAAFSAGLLLILLCSVFRFREYREPALIIGILIYAVFLTIWALRCATEEITQNRLLVLFDLSVLTLLAEGFFCEAMQIPAAAVLPVACGAACLLWSLTPAEENTPSGNRIRILRVLAFCVVAFLTYFAFSGLMEPAGKGLVALWKAFLSFCRTVLQLLYRMLVFLASLLPQAEYGPYESEPEKEYVLKEAQEGEVSVLSEVFCIAVLVIFGCWLLSLLIRFLAGQRTASRTAGKRRAKEKVRRKKPSFFAALRKAVSALFEKLRRKWYLLKNPESALGVYYHTEASFRLSSLRKRKSETASEFLFRLGEQFPDTEEEEFRLRMKEGIRRLSEAVNIALYAKNGENPVLPDAGFLRKNLTLPAVELRRSRGRDRSPA